MTIQIEPGRESHIRRVAGVDYRIIAAVLFCVGGLAIWITSLGHIDLRAVNDLGLISVLPVSFFLALMLLCSGFAVGLRTLHIPTLLLLICALLFVLYGTPVLIHEQPRFANNYVHAGLTEFISRTGVLAVGADARFSWPGFFALVAFFTQVAGVDNLLVFSAWVPLLSNFLYLMPLVVIGRSLSDDQRVVWLAVWLFCLTNWIGQDYISPQGFNFLLYLVVIAVLLGWFGGTPRRPNWLRLPDVALVRTGENLLFASAHSDLPGSSSRRAGLAAIIVVLLGAMVASHQLTPFFTLAAVTALVVFGRTVLRSLPVLLGLLIAIWLSYMTTAFLSGHLDLVVGGIGEVGGAVSANVTERIQGSTHRIIVLRTRLMMTIAVWTLGMLGMAYALWRGKLDVRAPLLALIPFPILIFQSYGGEMLLRIYLFTLPFMVIGIAWLMFPTPRAGHRWITTLLIAIGSIVVIIIFLLCRYGNERMDFMTNEEVAAVEFVYATAPPGAHVFNLSWNMPWRFQNYEYYPLALTGDSPLFGDMERIIQLMHDAPDDQAFLIVTRSQRAHLELLAGVSPAEWEQFEDKLLRSPHLETIYVNRDARVMTLSESSVP
jgi:hypothetical protein